MPSIWRLSALAVKVTISSPAPKKFDLMQVDETSSLLCADEPSYSFLNGLDEMSLPIY
jgi:hypothetical protein